MIDCMDKRLRDTSKSYLLAYLDPTKTEWLDRHMPSMLYCLHRHASVPSPLHVNLTFVHPTRSVRSTCPETTPIPSCTSNHLLSQISVACRYFVLLIHFWIEPIYQRGQNISSIPFQPELRQAARKDAPISVDSI